MNNIVIMVVLGMETFVEDIHVDHIIVLECRQNHFQHAMIPPLAGRMVVLVLFIIAHDGRHAHPYDHITVLLSSIPKYSCTLFTLNSLLASLVGGVDAAQFCNTNRSLLLSNHQFSDPSMYKERVLSWWLVVL
jgi:hypothetical protein